MVLGFRVFLTGVFLEFFLGAPSAADCLTIQLENLWCARSHSNQAIAEEGIVLQHLLES